MCCHLTGGYSHFLRKPRWQEGSVKLLITLCPQWERWMLLFNLPLSLSLLCLKQPKVTSTPLCHQSPVTLSDTSFCFYLQSAGVTDVSSAPFPFCPVWTLVQMLSSTFRTCLISSVKPLWKHPSKIQPRCVSSEILNPIKVKMRIYQLIQRRENWEESAH